MLQIATLLLTAACLTIVQARGGLLARMDFVPRALSARQTSIPDVSSQCASPCDPVNTIFSGAGCTPSTCCTADFANDYFNCFECVANATGITDFSTQQQNLDALYDECASLGISIPEFTFPGENASRTLSSVVNTGTGTGTSTTAASSVSVSPTSTSPVSQTVVTAPTIIPATTTSLIQSVVTALSTTPAPSATHSASSGRQAMGEVSLAPMGAIMIIGAWVMGF